jgi:hypothetical protein
MRALLGLIAGMAVGCACYVLLYQIRQFYRKLRPKKLTEYEMYKRTAELEHQNELVPHMDARVMAACVMPGCTPNRSLGKVGEPGTTSILYPEVDPRPEVTAFKSYGMSTNEIRESMCASGRECGFMGCGRPHCEDVCTPEPEQKISIGTFGLSNVKYVYDHPVLNALREKVFNDEQKINVRDREEQIARAISEHDLYKRRLVAADFDKKSWGTMEQKRKMAAEFRKLDARDDLTPEERDLAERKLLAQMGRFE